MKLPSGSVAAVLSAATAVGGSSLFLLAKPSQAFQAAIPSSAARSSASSVVLSSTKTDTDGSICAIPEDVNPVGVTASVLRSAVLTNVDGDKIKLGDVMGSDTSVVIFLRHLG